MIVVNVVYWFVIITIPIFVIFIYQIVGASNGLNRIKSLHLLYIDLPKLYFILILPKIYNIELFKMNHPMIFTYLPGSPNFTLCDYVFWGSVKNIESLSLLSSTKEELKIIALNCDKYVWNEIEFRLNVAYRVNADFLKILFYIIIYIVIKKINTTFIYNFR